MDLDLSNIPHDKLELISGTLMTVSKSEFNIFYPYFIYNVITSNDDVAWATLLENLPIYISTCLAYPEKEYISEYEELTFKMQKYYLCESVVKLLVYFHRRCHSTGDLCYLHAKKSVKVLAQNIFEDLNCYEVTFLCSISDSISEAVKTEKKSEDQEQREASKKLTDEIFWLLITLMHNLNERSHGIVGFQKLELVKGSSSEEAKSNDPPLKSKQLIDQYFKVQSDRSEKTYDEGTRKDISRINASVMKLVL